MLNKTIRHRLLATTVIAGAALASATPAFAQTTPAEGVPAQDQAAGPTTAGVSDQAGGDIIVTGSRIPQPNLSSSSPVTVIGAAEVRLQGVTRTEDLINNLPQAFAGQGGNLANGATGTATVDLRGLGAARTLVLVNGRRLIPGDPRSPVADINFIPASLIKRVDVLTGGASSVYGADAVSGVVNFIMDTDFEGLRVDGQYSLFNHNNKNRGFITDPLNNRGFGYPGGVVTDGSTIDTSIAVGAGSDDGKGHVTAYFGYRHINPILQNNRDYSSCALAANTPAQITARGGRAYQCGGSATSANGTFFTDDATLQVGPNNTFVGGSTPFNFAPYNYYQRPDERYTFGLFANYEVSDALKPYVEAMFMDDRTVAQIAPSGDFGNTNTINCDNPLLSAQQVAAICTPANFAGTVNRANGTVSQLANLQVLRRNVEGGGRRDDLQHTDYRAVVGARGEIAKGISYDGYYQYGRVNFAQTYRNDFSVTRLTRALDVVNVNGVPTCASVVDGTDPNCVPYNIFATTGGVTTAALNYLQTPGFSRGQTTEQVADASVTFVGSDYGFKSPFATSGIGANVGVEYRKETLNFEVDQAFSTGDLAGQGGATLPVAGAFNVKEVFGEVQIPLVSDRPFFEMLSVGAGYRYSKYNIDGNATTAGSSFSTDTYKFEAEFAPSRDIRFRGTYNRAVRAPNIVELFSSQSVALDGNSDPCASAVRGTAPSATAAQCALTGVTAAQYGNIIANPASQYNGLQGGNTALQPEKATTKSVGIVLTPTFLRGFSATVDAFDIKVQNNISAGLGADTILTQCIATGSPQFCGLIHRDATGSLFRSVNGFVVDTNLNIGAVRTRGIDIGAAYTQRITGTGSLGFSFVGTYLDRLTTDTGVLSNGRPVAYDCKGFYGLSCGTPNPEWRHKLRVNLMTESGVGISAAWRYFAPVRLDLTSSDVDLRQTNQATIAPANLRVASQSYFDLAATIPIMDKFTFRIGANNILDRDPPIIGSNALTGVTGNGNTFPQVYDALGRYVYVGVTLDL